MIGLSRYGDKFHEMHRESKIDETCTEIYIYIGKLVYSLWFATNGAKTKRKSTNVQLFYIQRGAVIARSIVFKILIIDTP